MARILKCIFINVNSIVSRHKRHYLNLFLRTHRPDVLMMAEHFLNARHKLVMEGYRIFRRDRVSGRGGGTAILVRDSIFCEEISLNTGAIENTAVRVHRADGNHIIFISMYLRPGSAFAASDFDAVRNLAISNSIVIGADLNSRHPYWGDEYMNVSGRNLREYLLMNPELDVHCTDGPTRLNPVTSSYIDFFLTTADIVNDNGNRLKTLDFESDHRAVEIVFRT